MPFNFKIISHRPNHKEFASVSSNQYLCLVEPSVSCEVTSFGQFLNFLVRLKRIILNFKQLKYIFACTANKVRLSRTNRY